MKTVNAVLILMRVVLLKNLVMKDTAKAGVYTHLGCKGP